MLDADEDRSESAMPLVLCRSRGGPYDDEAFMSGWRLGEIATLLGQPGVGAVADSIRPQERLQADLIAMARGYTMTVESTADAGWLSVTFARAQAAA